MLNLISLACLALMVSGKVFEKTLTNFPIRLTKVHLHLFTVDYKDVVIFYIALIFCIKKS